jgi:hypothetical protein
VWRISPRSSCSVSRRLASRAAFSFVKPRLVICAPSLPRALKYQRVPCLVGLGVDPACPTLARRDLAHLCIERLCRFLARKTPSTLPTRTLAPANNPASAIRLHAHCGFSMSIRVCATGALFSRENTHTNGTAQLKSLRLRHEKALRNAGLSQCAREDTTQTIRQRLRAFSMRFRAVSRSRSAARGARLRRRGRSVSATAWSRGPSSRPSCGPIDR